MNGSDLENMPDSFWKGIKYEPNSRSSSSCTCSKCGEVFNQPKSLSGLVKTCPECRGRPTWVELKKIVLKSHQKHTQPQHYIECKICGYRAKEIANHVITHGVKVEDYGVTKCQASIERVKGSKNPGYKHGGRLSPFSDKFKKYNDVSADYSREDVFNKREQTVKDNPQNQSTRIEYWLKRGLNEAEAKAALSDRQTTFSLDKCVLKYGDEEGLRVWKARQQKWLQTLDNKSDEEKLEINLKKIYRGGSSSKAEKELFTIIQEVSGLTLENQFKLIRKCGTKHFLYDMRYENKIIEYNGDYWHANPLFYNETDTVFRRRAADIWENDLEKANLALENGFELLVIWESDFKKEKEKTVLKCVEFLRK